MCANTNLKNQIVGLGMTCCGKIYEDEQKWLRVPKGSTSSDLKEATGLVYMWVRCSDNCEPLEVMYVGQAGGSLLKRLRQHESGFRHSVTGKRLAENIREVIGNGFEIRVYARESETVTLWSQDVSRCCLEEQALIMLFDSTWNTQRHHD